MGAARSFQNFSVIFVTCVFCLIVVPLPNDEPPFTVKKIIIIYIRMDFRVGVG
jgi:hypothetical protein